MSELQLRTVSTVEAVAQALREQVFDGTLAPGDRLPEVRYAEQLGVARHTFRAATATLVHEGLLRRDRNRGVQVPILGPADVEDIFRLRAALELEAVRVVMDEPAPGRRRLLEQLAAAVDELSRLDEGAPWRLVVDGDLHFHRGLIDAARSSRLAQAYAVVRSEIQLCLVQQRPLYDRPQQIAAEHRELLGAIGGEEPEHAAALFRAHLDDAARKLIDRLRREDEAQAAPPKENTSA